MSPDDEAFFRDIITKHPEFLSLSLRETNGRNLFDVVCESGGTSTFFQWLTSQSYAEETLLQFSQNGADCFCSAMYSGRQDCLRILFDLYGMETFQASGLDASFRSIVVMEDELLPILFFIFNELGYVPKPTFDMGQVLLATFQYIDAKVDLFKKLHRTFIERGCFINYQELFSAAVNDGKIAILRTMHEERMVDPDTALPVFKHETHFYLFLAKSSSTEVIAFLKNNNYKKIYKLDAPAYLIQLLNLGIISVEELLQQYPTSSPIWGSEVLISTIMSKDRELFKGWLTQCSFHDCFKDEHGFIKEDKEHRFLALMNKEKWNFQPEQLRYIHERWDSILKTIAKNQIVQGPLLADKLAQLIESITRSPNPAIHLKKISTTPTKLTTWHAGSTLTLDFESATPLQLLLLVGQTGPAAHLIKSGLVDWRQELNYTESMRINGVNVFQNEQTIISIPDFAHNHNLTEVKRAIQLYEAEAYLYKRVLEGNYKTQFSFFGFFQVHFGFSKQDKITAVRALISYLKDNIPIPETCKPALIQGELGKVTALNGVEYQALQTSSNKVN